MGVQGIRNKTCGPQNRYRLTAILVDFVVTTIFVTRNMKQESGARCEEMESYDEYDVRKR